MKVNNRKKLFYNYTSFHSYRLKSIILFIFLDHSNNYIDSFKILGKIIY